jgi:hypothetical protein
MWRTRNEWVGEYANMEKNAFNLAYFGSIRQEINDRIKIHYGVLTTKYIATGAAFSFLWTCTKDRPEWQTGAFVAPSLLSFFLDVLLLENLGWIKGAGGFIKKYVEKEPVDKEQVEDSPATVEFCPNRQGIVMWEHYIQPDGQWTCFSSLGYLFGVWSVGFLLFCGGIVTASASIADVHRGIALVTLMLLACSAIFYAYLPRRRWVGLITLISVIVLFVVNTFTVALFPTGLTSLVALTVNGVFSGYTLRLIKSRLDDFTLPDALMILLGLKRDDKCTGEKAGNE